MQMFFINGIECRAKHSPMKVHNLGLMQTSTGYGKKIATATMVNYKGKWRRVYCAIYSNIGTCYIGKLEDNLILKNF